MRILIATLMFSVKVLAAVAAFDGGSASNNVSARSKWLSVMGLAAPAIQLDFESGFANNQNVSGIADLFPGGLTITDTSTAHQVVVRSGAGIIGGSNPVGKFSLVHNEQPYLLLDFSANPVDYVGFLGIDHTAGAAIITFAGGTSTTVNLSATAGSGDSAQFVGIFRNDQPKITKVQFGPFPGGDGTWGIDNIEFGSLPDTPKPNIQSPFKIQTFTGSNDVFLDTSAISTPLLKPMGVAADNQGRVYILLENSTVLRLDPNGELAIVAGNGTDGFSGDNGPATRAQLNRPGGIAVDPSGVLYIADTNNARIRRVSNGIITTVAGNGIGGFAGDNGPATSAELDIPSSVASDSAGTLYVSDTGNARIRRVSNGVITTVAGNGTFGFRGDNGPATAASLAYPLGISFDSKSDLYIADNLNGRVRKVSSGVITTVAGGGSGLADGTPPLSAQFESPISIAVDIDGSLYIGDEATHSVRKVSKGAVTTFAGGGKSDGDNIPAASARYQGLTGLAIDRMGNLFVSDSSRRRVCKIVNGLSITVAGNGDFNSQLNNPQDIAFDSFGTLHVADSGNNRLVKLQDGATIPVAGTGVSGYAGDKGPATKALLHGPNSIAFSPTGDLYMTDISNRAIRKVSNGIITTEMTLRANAIAFDPAGNLYISDADFNVVRKSSNGALVIVAGGGTNDAESISATNALIKAPGQIAFDRAGNFYFAEELSYRVRKVSNGIITTVAGKGAPGFSGDNGPATNASLGSRFYSIGGIAVDGAGNLYIADPGNNRIRKVTKGIITTIAGNGAQGYSGDGGPATAASLFQPNGLALDASGNLYIADYGNNRIRKIGSDGIISTITGGVSFPDSTALHFPTGVSTDGTGNVYIADSGNNLILKASAATGKLTNFAGTGRPGFNPNGGIALKLDLRGPQMAKADRTGNVFIADRLNAVVWKVSSGGNTTLFAGNGVQGFSGDGGQAISAQLNNPTDIAFDDAGAVLIADTFNNRVRRVKPDGTIETIAGTGAQGFGGDFGPASAAKLGFPHGLAFDDAGNLYVSEFSNHRIRQISTDGMITTFAGTGQPTSSGDGGIAVSAALMAPASIAWDKTGSLYVAETGTHRVRKIDAAGFISTIAGIGTAGLSGDGGNATAAQLNVPISVSVTPEGNIFVADYGNNVVRKLIPPPVFISGVVNSGSNRSVPIAPGEIVTISGQGLGPAQMLGFFDGDAGPVDTTLGGTQVFFGGVPSPLLSVQSGQVTAIVPYELLPGATTQMQVVSTGILANSVSLIVAKAAPGVFTQDSSGAGPGMIIHSDGTRNSKENPAQPGSTITIQATGEGLTNPPGANGLPASGNPPQPLESVSVQIGGVEALVLNAGGISGLTAGFFQVTVQIPLDAPVGDAVPIVLRVGIIASQPGVTVSVAQASNLNMKRSAGVAKAGKRESQSASRPAQPIQ